MRGRQKSGTLTGHASGTQRQLFRFSSTITLRVLAGALIVSTIFVTTLIATAESNRGTIGNPGTAIPATAFPETLRSLEFASLKGPRRSLDHWKGDLIVLNFWATWCPPCIREMPLFQEYHERFVEQGLSIVTIAIDRPDAVLEFVSQLGLEFPVLLGLEDGMGAARAFGNSVGALPFTVVIDRHSLVRDQRLGEVHAPDLDAWIQDLL